MNGEVWAAIIGAGVVAIGWVVTYVQQQSAKAKENEEAFLRRQLEEFYAPLLALIQQKIFVQQVEDARMKTVPGGESWVKTLRFFEDTFIVPVMQSIAQLLRTKSYLAVDWPPSFDQYLEHEAKSVALYQLWRDTDIPGEVDVIPWPTSLEEDVRTRKARLDELLRSRHILPG